MTPLLCLNLSENSSVNDSYYFYRYILILGTKKGHNKYALLSTCGCVCYAAAVAFLAALAVALAGASNAGAISIF